MMNTLTAKELLKDGRSIFYKHLSNPFKLSKCENELQTSEITWGIAFYVNEHIFMGYDLSAGQIELLDKIREAVMAEPKNLCMGSWECGSTRCITGWLWALNPDLREQFAVTKTESVEHLRALIATESIEEASQLIDFHPSEFWIEHFPELKTVIYGQDHAVLKWLEHRVYSWESETGPYFGPYLELPDGDFIDCFANLFSGFPDIESVENYCFRRSGFSQLVYQGEYITNVKKESP